MCEHRKQAPITPLSIGWRLSLCDGTNSFLSSAIPPARTGPTVRGAQMGEERKPLALALSGD